MMNFYQVWKSQKAFIRKQPQLFAASKWPNGVRGLHFRDETESHKGEGERKENSNRRGESIGLP